MATLQFQIHTDKENPISAGVKTMAGGVQGMKAKSFQAHKTPRRALGSVNEASRVGLGGGRTQPGPHDLKSSITAQPTALKPKNAGVTHRDSKLKGQLPDKENLQQSKQPEEKGCVHGVKAKQQQQQHHPVSYCLPAKHYVPPSSQSIYDEDALPLRKRPNTYVHKLLSWRPPCLFGTMSDSDCQEEEKEHQRMMDEMDSLDHDIFPLASLALSCESLDVDSVPLPSLDDVPLPFIDGETQQDSGDLPLPFIDEETEQDSGDLPLPFIDGETQQDSSDLPLPLPSIDGETQQDSGDLPLPFIDEEAEQDSSALSMSPPELDNSVGLMPHLGSLELLDFSLPSLSQ